MDRSEWFADVVGALEATTEALEVLRRGHGAVVSEACFPALNLGRAALSQLADAAIAADYAAQRAAAPPPPAEQASGEHVEVLREFAEDYRRYIPQFHAQNRKRMKRNLADLDAAIAALSQRPVVDEDRLFKVIRSFGYTTTWQTGEIVDAVLAALAHQRPEKGEDDDDSDRDPCEVCLDRSCNGECGGDCP